MGNISRLVPYDKELRAILLCLLTLFLLSRRSSNLPHNIGSEMQQRRHLLLAASFRALRRNYTTVKENSGLDGRLCIKYLF